MPLLRKVRPGSRSLFYQKSLNGVLFRGSDKLWAAAVSMFVVNSLLNRTLNIQICQTSSDCEVILIKSWNVNAVKLSQIMCLKHTFVNPILQLRKWSVYAQFLSNFSSYTFYWVVMTIKDKSACSATESLAAVLLF